MERADQDRSARPATGALGVRTTAPGAATGAAGREPGERTPAPRGSRSAFAAALRRAAGRPAARQAALILAFLAAGIAVTWPRAAYLTGQVPSNRDSASYVWGFWWVARQVTHLHNPWFTHYMAAPVGVQLGFHTLMPLPGLLLTPVTLAFGPAVSYNLMVAVVPGLLCYAMYRAARLWLRSATAAIAAGAFFGLSSMLTQQSWYHINIAAGALFLPLALEASVRLRRRPGRRQAIILGLVMGVAVLTDQESSVLAAIVTGLVLLPWLLARPAWARLWPAGLAVLVGTVIATPQIIAMIAEIGVGGLTIPPQLLAVSYKQYGIGLPGMFSPTPRVSDFGMGALAGPFLHGRDNEGMPMFGAVLTALALAGAGAAWRRRSTWLLAGLWADCAALALGTSLWIGKHQYLPLAATWNGVRVSNLMPYTWFVRIPGLSSFREADRLAILGLMPAALLAGAAVEWIRYHARRRAVMIAALVLIAAFGALEAGYSGSPHVRPLPTSFPGVDVGIAADHSRSAVLDLPYGLRGGIPVYGVPFFPQALVMATEDGHPRSIAYTSRIPVNTIKRIKAHPFYNYLVFIQHQVPRVCPWTPQIVDRNIHLGCQHPPGVVPPTYLKIPPAQLAAAGRDATRMGIGWAVMWKRNISADGIVRPYLLHTGFTYCYRDGNVLVYRHGNGHETTSACLGLQRLIETADR